MALTLRNAISDSESTIDVNGSDTLAVDGVYSIGSELIVVRRAVPQTLGYGQSAYQRLSVYRQQYGSTAASHAAGTALTAAPLGGGGGSNVPDPSTGNVGDVPTVNAGQDAYELAAPSGGGNQRAVVNLTAAQIRLLDSVPVELVPAPGAGKVIWAKEWLWQYTFVSVAYDTSAMQLRWTGSATYNILVEQNVPLQSPISRVGSQPLAAYDRDDKDAEDSAIEVFSAAAPGAAGDGTARLIVEYEIVTLA